MRNRHADHHKSRTRPRISPQEHELLAQNLGACLLRVPASPDLSRWLMGLKGAASLARNTLNILAMELPQADALLPELPRSVWGLILLGS
jgi:hypothetical protein